MGSQHAHGACYLTLPCQVQGCGSLAGVRAAAPAAAGPVPARARHVRADGCHSSLQGLAYGELGAAPQAAAVCCNISSHRWLVDESSCHAATDLGSTVHRALCNPSAACLLIVQRTAERKRHARIAQVVSNACRQRRVVAVWICWLEYVARRQQQQQDLQQVGGLGLHGQHWSVRMCVHTPI